MFLHKYFAEDCELWKGEYDTYNYKENPKIVMVIMVTMVMWVLYATKTFQQKLKKNIKT